jgi:Protein of unknown function (DUF1588)/Protein of unknown function (DUF1585)/Protein of unknown function (DUF1592)
MLHQRKITRAFFYFAFYSTIYSTIVGCGQVKLTENYLKKNSKSSKNGAEGNGVLGTDNLISKNPPAVSDTGEPTNPAEKILDTPEALFPIAPNVVQRPTKKRAWRISDNIFVSAFNQILPADKQITIGTKIFTEEAVQTKKPGNAAGTRIDRDSAKKVYTTAKEQSGNVVAFLEKQIQACAKTPADANCEKEFFLKLTKVLWRKTPTSSEETQNLKLVKDLTTAGLSRNEALQGLFRSMVQSPKFLFQFELQNFSKEEISVNISQILTPNKMPLAFSDWLKNNSSSRDDLRKIILNLLNSADSKAFATDYFSWILRYPAILTIEKNDFVGTALTPQIRASLKKQADSFVEDLWSKNLPFADFLKQPTHTYAPEDLNSVFKNESQISNIRSGLLNLPSVLIVHNKGIKIAPVPRGILVMEKLLCEGTLPPPSNFAGLVKNPLPGQTLREAFETVTSSANCISCHSRINPPGFSFENFDALGRYRPDENGISINAGGTYLVGGTDYKFKNSAELLNTLSSSPIVGQCLMKNLFRYVTGRDEASSDNVILREMYSKYKETGGNMKAAIAELMSHPTTWERAE